MPKPTLAERLLAAREFWCDLPELGEGRRVKLRRPAETKIVAMHGGVTLDDVQTSAVAWEGITEADLLGAEVGASDPVPFEAEAWKVLSTDNIQIAGRVASKLNEVITAHIEKVAGARGN